MSRPSAAFRLALLLPLTLQLSGCGTLRAFLIPSPPAAGQRVRVSGEDWSPPTLTGRLVALTDDSVILGRDSTIATVGAGFVTGRLALSLDTIEQIEVSRGVHPNVVRGALIGTALGSLVGLALLCPRINDCLGHRPADPPLGQVLGIMVGSMAGGMLVGGTVGAYIRSEQWDLVPLDALRRAREASFAGTGMRLKVGLALFPAFPWAPR